MDDEIRVTVIATGFDDKKKSADATKAAVEFEKKRAFPGAAEKAAAANRS
jgi:cell division GTPase FtsZ